MKSQMSNDLKSAELKVTEPRKAVLAVLSSSEKPLDVETIVKRVDTAGIDVDQATVYRILKTFVDKGIIHKVSLQEGKTHYERTDRPHHHHVICVTCGDIADIEACGIEDIERSVEKTTGFIIQSHSFELFGLCPNCKN